MPSQAKVKVKFETKASQRFIRHKHGPIPLDPAGNGSFMTAVGETDLILFGMTGPPGTTAKITLSVVPPKALQIAGHPIEGKTAQGKTVWGDSRFFRVI